MPQSLPIRTANCNLHKKQLNNDDRDNLDSISNFYDGAGKYPFIYIMGQWDNGTMGQWDNGIMGQWEQESKKESQRTRKQESKKAQ